MSQANVCSQSTACCDLCSLLVCSHSQAKKLDEIIRKQYGRTYPFSIDLERGQLPLQVSNILFWNKASCWYAGSAPSLNNYLRLVLRVGLWSLGQNTTMTVTLSIKGADLLAKILLWRLLTLLELLLQRPLLLLSRRWDVRSFQLWLLRKADFSRLNQVRFVVNDPLWLPTLLKLLFQISYPRIALYKFCSDLLLILVCLDQALLPSRLGMDELCLLLVIHKHLLVHLPITEREVLISGLQWGNCSVKCSVLAHTLVQIVFQLPVLQFKLVQMLLELVALVTCPL